MNVEGLGIIAPWLLLSYVWMLVGAPLMMRFLDPLETRYFVRVAKGAVITALCISGVCILVLIVAGLYYFLLP